MPHLSLVIIVITREPKNQVAIKRSEAEELLLGRHTETDPTLSDIR